MQKLVRAGFGNNNVDTCARVCHSPTGYGLKTTFGTSAGTQDFKSVDKADVILRHRRQPDRRPPGLRLAHEEAPARGRAGSSSSIPRRIDLVQDAARRGATITCSSCPAPTSPCINAIAHVVVTEGLVDEDFVASAATSPTSSAGRASSPRSDNSPEATEALTGVPAADVRAAARLYATGGNAAIYYGLGVTEHSQGSTMVMAMANLAMATGNIGRDGVGVNPLRGQNNVQGSCDMGSFPHEFSGYRHVSDDATRAHVRERCGARRSASEPGLRIPNMFDEAVDGTFKGLYIQGEDIAQSDPNTQHVTAGLEAMECVVVQDLFLNETAKLRPCLPARLLLPGEGRHLHQRRAPHQPRAQGDAADGRAWPTGRSRIALSKALGYPMHYSHPSRDHGRDRAAHARPSPACPTSSSTSSAPSSGPATTRRPRARRSCMSTASCAARASS